MKKSIRYHLVILVCLVATYLSGCTQVAITGRKQLRLLPDSMLNSMALNEYNAFLKENSDKLSNVPAKTAMLARVGDRIARSVESYYTSQGNSNLVQGYNWEFNLVESKEKNAWAMPGGKVVVYTGLLDVTQTEAGLAAVVGHEIAHAIARHGNERMSQSMLFELGGVALSQAVKTQPDKTRELFMQAYGVGGTIGVMLPFSRVQETEADHLGLIYMAMAGYDPHEAVGVWQRMKSSSDGQAPPEFLSTHPANETRIAYIPSKIPEVMKSYAGPGKLYQPPVHTTNVPYYQLPESSQQNNQAVPSPNKINLQPAPKYKYPYEK